MALVSHNGRRAWQGLKRAFPHFLLSGVDQPSGSLPAGLSLFHTITLAGNQREKNVNQTNNFKSSTGSKRISTTTCPSYSLTLPYARLTRLFDKLSPTSCTMDLRITPVTTPSILRSRPEARNTSNKGSTDQRRPVRRDLEKRRQQNIQAQKKYRK